mmetsp:Transcript_1355/g.3837  ORF Transcript_1355/g.3837 Transcript_1355/m.3837 type:complete len:312 (+) Transcript_1355:112-1047(+)
MGNSTSKDLEEAKTRLAAAEKRTATLADEKAKLDEKVRLQAQTLDLQQKALSDAVESSSRQLRQKDDDLAKALKQKQLAEGLRRSDALLAKRLLHSQLRHLGGASASDGASVGELDGSVAAAAAALSACDEMQLRQMLMHTTSELEALKQRSATLERAAKNHHWSELTRELWVPQSPRESYLSVTQRGARQLMAGGLRVTPLSPMLSVMQQFGSPEQDKWCAVGGSYLYNAQKGIGGSTLRVGVCAQPAPTQQIAISYDHNIIRDGHMGVSGSCKTTRDSLTARLFGTLDIQGGTHHRAGLELIYDVPDKA